MLVFLINHTFFQCKKTKPLTFIQQTMAPLLVIIASLLIGGCELMPQHLEQTSAKATTSSPKHFDSHFSHYYLWIKSLSEDELYEEIEKQKKHQVANFSSSNVNLALLYALPRSPIFNPYTAKTQLNQITSTIENIVETSSADFGFITMIKDQLNQQILALNKLALAKQKLQHHQESLLEKKTVTKEQAAQILRLTQQIEQLKKIEHNINNQQ